MSDDEVDEIHEDNEFRQKCFCFQKTLRVLRAFVVNKNCWELV